MKLECRVISFTKRPYTDKNGQDKVFTSVLVQVGQTVCELAVSDKIVNIAQGDRVLSIGLTAWQYKPRFFVDEVVK